MFYNDCTCIARPDKNISNTAIIILWALNVILPEVSACLDLDENQVFISGIHDTVPGSLFNIHSLSCFQRYLLIIQGYDSSTLHNIPVLHPL